MLIFYDFEVFKNLWTLTCIDIVRQQKTVFVNNKDGLEKFYNEHKDEIFIGYNSTNYDQWIMRAILCGFNPKAMNDWIIVPGIDKDGKEYHRKGKDFSDLTKKNYQINNFDVFNGTNGLKTLEAFMGNDIRECEIPFDYEGEFTPEMIEEVLKYNENDVIETIKVFFKRISMFESQVDLLKTFNLPRNLIGMTQTTLVGIILDAKPVQTNDEWEIRMPDTLKLEKYTHVRDWFLDPANHYYRNDNDEDNFLGTTISGVPHKFAWGGLHGAIPKFHYKCKPDEILIMADVNQLYPSIMIEYDLLARGVKEPERFKNILATSLRLKDEAQMFEDAGMDKEKEEKKKEREPYKLICNRCYGAMGFKSSYNPMYDPLHRNLVCVFGQVLLLDLIEKIEPVCKLVQSNTDGILVLVKRKDLDTFKGIVSEWEDRTRLKMAYDEYEKIAQKDVNNYVATDYRGKYKTKGGYVKELNPLDNDLPIVNKAVTDYLVNRIHPRDTIMASDKFIDFQKVVKVSKKYAYGTWNGKRLNDKTFRVFASRRLKDGIIGKVKEEGATIEKFASTPDRCFIWNESVNDVPVPSYLDRQWYIDLAIKRLDDFGIQI